MKDIMEPKLAQNFSLFRDKSIKVLNPEEEIEVCIGDIKWFTSLSFNRGDLDNIKIFKTK